MFLSMWYVVDAVNELQQFDIQYPKSAEEQKKIAKEFMNISMALIPMCASAIDDILIWI